MQYRFGMMTPSSSDNGNLGMGEACGQDGIVIHGVRLAAYVFDGAYALRARRVRKHHLPVGIPDAVQIQDDDALVAVLRHDTHLWVDGDESAQGLYACGFESHVGGVRDATGGDHGGVDLVGLDMLPIV